MNAAAIAAAARAAPFASPRRSQSDDETDVDDGLARAVESRVHEGAELAGLAGRAGERAIEQVEGGTKADDEPRPGSRAGWPPGTAPMMAMPKPISVSMFGVRWVRMKIAATGASIRARNAGAERRSA